LHWRLASWIPHQIDLLPRQHSFPILHPDFCHHIRSRFDLRPPTQTISSGSSAARFGWRTALVLKRWAQQNTSDIISHRSHFRPLLDSAESIQLYRRCSSRFSRRVPAGIILHLHIDCIFLHNPWYYYYRRNGLCTAFAIWLAWALPASIQFFTAGWTRILERNCSDSFPDCTTCWKAVNLPPIRRRDSRPSTLRPKLSFLLVSKKLLLDVLTQLTVILYVARSEYMLTSQRYSIISVYFKLKNIKKNKWLMSNLMRYEMSGR